MATSLDTSMIPVTFKTLGGGLNTSSGPLGIDDGEASDLQNIDFSKFGSILERNGYTVLNTSPTSSSGTSQGLYWYSTVNDRFAVVVNSGKIYKMDNLDGNWDDITGAVEVGVGGIDSYTVLMLHCDGSQEGITFTDSSASVHVVTNTETYDNYTVLMLHCDGADGLKTFTDVSLGTHTAVSISGTSLDTSTYRFGTASCLFDGTDDCLSIPDSPAWHFSSTDFTVDLWFKFNQTPNETVQQIFSQATAANTGVWLFLQNSSGVNYITFRHNNAGVTVYDATAIYGGSWDMDWHHLAVSRSSGTSRIFLDGVLQTLSINTPGTMPDLARPFFIGANDGDGSGTMNFFFNGWLDEFRITKGLARWTSTFNVPTTPYGKVYTTTSHYKFPTAGAEFKGYERLSVADNANFFFSTTNFTIDFWTKINNLTNGMSFLGQYEDGNNYWYLKKDTNANGNKLSMKFVDGAGTKGDFTMTNAWPLTAGTWYHLAFQRSGTNGTIWINGTSQALTSTTSFGTSDVGDIVAPLLIGQQNNTIFLEGWLDEIRISKGIARYSTTFTPNTGAYDALATSGSFLGSTTRQDFETFLGYLLGSSSDTHPWQWLSTNSTASSMTVVSGLTGAKFLKKFQNYLILANVKISGINYPSRFYWSGIRDITSWDAADWIEVSREDGEEITGLRVLGDRLVVYKNHSIYIVLFTGDPDIPFTVQKSNSAVGCAAPFSIQDVENGHVFMSYDGIYYFDGMNSYKLSDKINETFSGLSKEYLDNAVSMYQKTKNKYWLSCPSGTSQYNNFILVYDTYLKAWSKYTGFSASAMSIFMVNGVEERPYFSDYSGYAYRADYGLNDNPCKISTSIDAYYYTNWKHYEDICDNKGIPHVYIVHRNESDTDLSFSYSYDFYNGDQYTSTFSLSTTQSVTSLTTRRDLTGRGKFARFKFQNTASNTSFRIDGLGTYVTKESKS